MRCAGDTMPPSEVGPPGAVHEAPAACANTSNGETESPSGRAWTFLTNHARVLLCVAQHPGIRVREVAQSVGVTERCVQRILTELEEAGYVSRTHQGRRNYYEVHADLPLRHPSEQHRQVSALISLVLGGQVHDQESER